MKLDLTLASESKLAGSAGIDSSTHLVSTATTPVGMPPSLPRERYKIWSQQLLCFVPSFIPSRMSWNTDSVTSCSAVSPVKATFMAVNATQNIHI